MSFSTIIKELRIEAGLTQLAIANEFSVCKTTVTRWESGKNEPSLNMLMRIANFFQVSVDELIGYEFFEDERKFLYAQEEIELVNGYRKIKEDSKKYLKMFLDSAVKADNKK